MARREIDSSDGVPALFADASDALDYVRAYHAAILELPYRYRHVPGSRRPGRDAEQ